MRRTIYLAVLSSAVIGLAALLTAGSSRNAALADSGCTNHSLRGPYGFAIEGQAFNPPGPGYHEVAEFADAGRIVFDGAGTLKGTDTESLNGHITRGLTFTGTYAVQADCSGTATITGGITANLRFMIVERGQEVNAIDTDLGVTATGQITRQEIDHCSDATLKGVYSNAGSGTLFSSPGNPAGEAADVAASDRLLFDGRGHGTGSISLSVNGVPTGPQAETATFTVQGDCTGSAANNLGNQVDFVVVERGTELKIIVTNEGFVLAASADKQPIGEGGN